MGRFTDPALVSLAENTKEDYEVLEEMFFGNKVYWENFVTEHVKIVKIIDLI